jgi:arylsulfatase A-like enzyme
LFAFLGTALVAVAVIVGIAMAERVVRKDKGGEPPRREAAPNSPNIVWLMTDDQDVASMRVMKKTQRLLGDEGVTFDDSITAWPLCCPSRATLQTGQYPHNHEVLENKPPLGGYGRLKKKETLPVWLGRAGYTTAHVGKFMNDYKGHEVPPGWSEWYGLAEPSNRYFKPQLNENGEKAKYGKKDKDYSTDLFTRKATKVIADHAGDREPFFLSVGYVAPHVGTPLKTKDPRCDENGPEPAPRHEGAFRGVQIPRTPAFDEQDLSDKPAAMQKLPRLGKELISEKTDRYQCRLASLLAVDDSVAEIVDALREAGQLDNTYIVLTSDNGYLSGQHRMLGGKSVLYEESLRVPLVIRGPGIPAGETSPSLVSNVDWAATILDIANARAELPLDGESFLEDAEDPTRQNGRAQLIESARERYTGVRTPGFVYAEYYGGGAYADGDVEMYDLAKDPDELENVADDPAYADEREQLIALHERLRECKGGGCDVTARIQLEAERAGQAAGSCDPKRASVALAGDDAALVRAVTYSVDGAPVADPKGEAGEPVELDVPADGRTELSARATLVDGRVIDIGARLTPCS